MIMIRQTQFTIRKASGYASDRGPQTYGRIIGMVITIRETKFTICEA